MTSAGNDNAGVSIDLSPLSISPSVTPEVVALETSCGWKGKLCDGTTTPKSHVASEPRKNNEELSRSGDSTESMESNDESRQSNYASDGGIRTTVETADLYMGGEPSLLSIETERQGILDILKALSTEERQQLNAFDRTMPIRHFRAEKGDTDKAIAQIKATLQWRTEFGVDVIVSCFAVQGTPQDTSAHQEMRDILMRENDSAKIYVRGYDSDGRALMYMTPARENTNNELNNMRHLVWNLEKAIACTARRSVAETMARAVDNGKATVAPSAALEKIHLLIDYDGFKLKDAPPMSTTRYTLDILQKHYPERMKHAFLLNPPFVFRAFWALIKSFVDPVTKAKIVFCSGSEGQAQLTNKVTDKHKLEARSYGSNPNVRSFDSVEYLHLPFNICFDEDVKQA